MNNLKQTTAIVEHILRRDVQSRNSDSYLYLKVLEHQAKANGVNLETLTVPFFLQSLSALGFAPFESVRRTRQKVQAKNPDLAACEAVAEFRADNEREYRGYALSDCGDVQ